MGAGLLALARFVIVDIGGLLIRSHRDDTHRVEIDLAPNQSLLVDGIQINLAQLAYPPWEQSLDSTKLKGFSVWAEVDMKEAPPQLGRIWAVMPGETTEFIEFTSTPERSIALWIKGNTPIASTPNVWKFDLLQVRRIPFTFRLPELKTSEPVLCKTSLQTVSASVVPTSPPHDRADFEATAFLMIDWERLRVSENEEVFVTAAFDRYQQISTTSNRVELQQTLYSGQPQQALALVIIERRIPFEVRGVLREVPMTRK